MLQPYQILFPIGLLYGLWGALVWVLHLGGHFRYPGDLHAHLMIGGFLFSFALGFLMTAVPRFTGAEPANRWEIVAAAVLSSASFFGLYQNAVALAVLLFLAFFFLSRFTQRTYSPPKHFVFIPIGLLLGISGVILMMTGSYTGRIFFYQGTMLCFVLGVGGKLVSALLGWSAPPMVQISRNGAPTKESLIPPSIALPALLLTSGFLLELTPWLTVGRLLRAAAGSWVAIDAWKLHRRPKIKGRLANWLWISSWSLVAGLWLYAAVPTLGVHGLHLVFIGGFGLMTLMIASRVTLAHGGYDLDLELKSKAIRLSGALIVLAAATRVSAPFTPSYMSHLGYAAVTWVVALAIWFYVFFPRIVFHAGDSGKGPR